MCSSMALPLTFLFFWFSVSTMRMECRKTYIVCMDATQKPSTHATDHEWYVSHLKSLSIPVDRHLLYTYTDALQGFAAALDPDHLPLLRSHPSVLHLHPDPLLHVHTTRTPEFLGLYNTLRSTADAPLHVADAATHRVVVGVLDTGVWPEVSSFDDAGFPDPPATWRGGCDAGKDFHPSLCNKKLVGARSFFRGFRAADGALKRKERISPRDRDGHGTHTASTAAGSPVANASLFGYAAGTARGMAPAARVAVYKVCWGSGCYGSDILAGIDRAISDGVDVLSLSLGGGSSPYHRDTIAVAAFAAHRRGIFVSCSAGNRGPRRGSLANTAPWLTTVGAGTIDRDFPAYVSLGNGERHVGVSLYSGRGMRRKMAPLVYLRGGGNSSNLCLPGTLVKSKVRGKVVLCDRGITPRVEKGKVVRAAGGVGMVLANTAANGEELVADSHVLPALAVGSRAGEAIRRYASRSGRSARAVIRFRGTVLRVRPSPVVAAFSSRGPNMLVPQVLKPDVIGPGVNILAGWSGSVGPTGLDSDRRRSDFNVLSGTSMSCPHISGLAALLKAAHPDWSPAAIKSALMTTAYTVDNTGSPLRDAADGSTASPYAYGAGHVNPRKAVSPGLVYDITTDDYVSFLCSLKYTPVQIRTITSRANVSCAGRFRDPGDLNYPSFSVLLRRVGRRVRYVRELTNVGAARSVYHVKVSGPAGVKVRVKPPRLAFRRIGQKLRYVVTFVPKENGGRPGEVESGWITWKNKEHEVRSPVVYTWTAA